MNVRSQRYLGWIIDCRRPTPLGHPRGLVTILFISLRSHHSDKLYCHRRLECSFTCFNNTRRRQRAQCRAMPASRGKRRERSIKCLDLVCSLLDIPRQHTATRWAKCTVITEVVMCNIAAKLKGGSVSERHTKINNVTHSDHGQRNTINVL